MIKYAHTNLVASDWKRLAAFYEAVFECLSIPPGRDLSGQWLDKATGLEKVNIRGIHLRMPGFGGDGPTLEIFEYGETPERPQINTNTPGFSHIAFAVDDVQGIAEKVLAQGGAFVGEITEKHIEGVGDLTFQYVTDPEGNIIELQSWARKRA